MEKLLLVAYDNCRITESLCCATKIISHTVKNLLHQYTKYWFCVIFKKGELASSFVLNIELS